MLFFKNFSFRLPLAALALAALVLPLAAGAQEAPEPGVIPVPGAVPGDVQPYPPSVQAPQAPYYAPPPVYASQDETIHGRIQSIEGTFNLTFADDRGFLDNVVLRQGTIINPTGLTLAPGMAATIIGFASGNAFNANEIDTPYTYSGPAPTPAYYGAGWWYPGYAYGYGPSFSLALFFGSGGGWYVQPCAWGGRGYTYQPIYGWNPNYPVAYHGPMNNLPRYGQQAFPQGNPQQVGLHTGPGTSPGSPGQGGPPQNGHGAPGNTPGQPGQFGPPGTGRTAPGNPAPGQSGPPEQVIGHLGPGNSTPPGNAPGNVNPPGYAHTGSNGNPWQRFGSSGGSAYQSPSGGGYARVPSPSYDHAVRY
ncbi:MAG TPA: hypothetical protein VKG44_00945, partial [Candidatus Baltobacteraceae bacterium]|nr:hypothetical protein [Candidatus Baltobacteraceae bacterium]